MHIYRHEINKRYLFTARPRKRKRKIESHKSYIAKQRVERGEEHQSKKKKIAAKTFVAQNSCKCKDPNSNCATVIHAIRQKEIFDSYYKKMQWSQKTLFIRASVKRTPVKTKRSALYPIIQLKPREFNHVYSLTDENGVRHEICRDFFLKCLQITPTRVLSALTSETENPSAAENRGKAPPANKTKQADMMAVRQFIDSIPKYESHYGRSSSKKKYLHHNLNMAKIYHEYKEKQEMTNQSHVSQYIFREIFNTEYNLSFKRRHTDTCKTCDEFETSLKSSIVPPQAKGQFQLDKQCHLDLVSKTNASFKADVEAAAKSDGQTIVLTFDLEKALETPVIATSVAFYKRQLWTYNLCVFDEVSKTAFMYVWSENVASRGGQEIGSCLLKHFKDNVSSKVSKIILYSDSCGGQNRNIKLTMMLKKYLHDLTPDDSLTTIEQKYFVSGHSYNSCDRSFGIIENERKKSSNIFTPNDWAELIRNAKKSEPNFQVTVMQGNDFLSSSNLHSLIVNRKKNKEKEKINWFGFRSILYDKDKPFQIDFKYADDKTQTISIAKKKIGPDALAQCDMTCLFPNGRAISDKKYTDIMLLLKYIPHEHHDFFKNIKFDDSEDFGLASDTSE